ncbi:MAG TPA: ABC transporter permease [Nitriliruptoraceae bacterium]|nr:ABC transporter permease [Nitriliruptoraceae bacterium]
MGAPAPRHRAVRAQAGLELRLLLRNPESLLVTLGIPLGVLVFFSVVDILPVGDDPVAFLVPGVLVISSMGTGLVAVAIQTAFERKYGVLKRIGATPLTHTGYLMAKGLAVVAMVAFQVVAILAVAVLFLGWRTNGMVVVAVLGTLLGGFVFAAIGLWMAGSLKAEMTLALSNTLFLVLVLVSGLAFDPASLPGPVAAFAGLLPSGALGDVLRSALAVPGSVDVVGIVVVFAWGVVATVAAAATFSWEP